MGKGLHDEVTSVMRRLGVIRIPIGSSAKGQTVPGGKMVLTLEHPFHHPLHPTRRHPSHSGQLSVFDMLTLEC